MQDRRSVTQTLDAYTEPEIWEWKLRVGVAKAKRVSEEALKLGKEIDLMIQQDLQGKGLDRESEVPEIQNAIEGWNKFKEKHPEYARGIECIQAELVQGNLVGHPDIIHLKEVADIKTSKWLVIRPKWVVQASRYAVMAKKDRASIILLSKVAPTFLYVWWEGEMVEYFGNKVFAAFETIFEYRGVASEMVRGYMEKEMVG